jgi:hypothetical protein
MAQPPSPTRKSEAKGRTQCEKRLPMNFQVRVGSSE